MLADFLQGAIHDATSRVRQEAHAHGRTVPPGRIRFVLPGHCGQPAAADLRRPRHPHRHPRGQPSRSVVRIRHRRHCRFGDRGLSSPSGWRAAPELPICTRASAAGASRPFCGLFKRWETGALAVSTAVPFPTPTSFFFAAAGASNYSRRKYLIVVGLCRAARYSLIAILADRYGHHFVRAVRHPGQYWGWLLLTGRPDCGCGRLRDCDKKAAGEHHRRGAKRISCGRRRRRATTEN